MITIVSGLPRSGTSMVMRMLEAGGMPLLVDHVRTADEDNPLGYYEFEAVKRLARDQSWLGQAENKAVKIITALLHHVPTTFTYRVIFLQRDLGEVLASQAQMLARQGQQAEEQNQAALMSAFQQHLQQVQACIEHHPSMQALYVQHHAIIAQPYQQAGLMSEFLGTALDVERMAASVEARLYRQRQNH